MNYYVKGDKTKAEQIKAAFEKLGIRVPDYRICMYSSLIYFSLNGEVLAVTIKALELFQNNPDYKELELPVEPKFKVGDWVVKKDGETFYGGNYAEQITLIEVDEKGKYIWLPSKTWVDADDIRLWTIADAKLGDVITDGKLIVIFNKFEEPAYRQHIIAYVGLDLCGKLQITEDTWRLGIGNAMPATKEQRDLLFAKMKEAGYTWDDEKKELRKIKPHYDIANFKPFDKVLGRNCCRSGVWKADYFSHIHKNGKLFVGIGYTWEQCIPFNDDTKHLLGTSNPCDEQYKNW